MITKYVCQDCGIELFVKKEKKGKLQIVSVEVCMSCKKDAKDDSYDRGYDDGRRDEAE